MVIVHLRLEPVEPDGCVCFHCGDRRYLQAFDLVADHESPAGALGRLVHRPLCGSCAAVVQQAWFTPDS
ncbi:MAG: hypothetical protein ACOC3G_05970 [Phycisphaeraceae bacterium]